MTGQTRRTRTGSWPARSWLAASAAVLLVVAAVARLVLTEATADAAERRSGVSAGDGGAAAPGTLPAPAPGGTQSLPLLEGEPAPEPDAPAGASPPAGRFAGLAGLPHERFRGRVLDPDGQPLAGAVVYFVPAHAAFHALGHDLWWEHQLEPDELTRTSTDARGEFALDGPHVTRCVDGEQLGDTWAAEPGLIAWAPGYAAHPHVCIGYRGGPCDVGDLLVEAEARLHGRIVDEGGRPLEGVVVRYIVDQLDPARLPADAVRCEDDMLEIVQRARTDADGRFALGGLWQGLGQLRLTVESQVATAVQDIRPVSGQDLDVGTLTMSAGGSLAGVVVDAEGRPVPGAEVVLTGALGYRPRWPEVDLILEEQAFGDAFGRRLAVDDAGRFRAQGLEPEESFALFARSPAHDVALLDELRPGPGEQVLTPSPAATLRVEVLDAVDGAALPGAFVVARRIAARGDDEVLIPLAVEPAPDGEPGTWLVRRAGRVGTLLVVSAAGHTTQTHRADGLDAGARRDETVRLARELGVTGRVEDLDGAPIPAATVKA
ncbi:MAG TPA: carboxypeptidase-like regulatory domain-containing protein [Planctomycetota bacterium]|nr:carboxypeptidase-like regulatory domain-containing protein [Planctomycetota bacterium]